VQEPHLFVIRRQLRAPPAVAAVAGGGAGGAGGGGGGPRAATQGVYYILGDAAHTYQAPSLHAAVNARLRRCMHFVRQGMGRFKVRAGAGGALFRGWGRLFLRLSTQF
jgi:hypothetical protein